MQLVVYTGPGFEGFTRKHHFAKFQKIGPKPVDIPTSFVVKIGPSFGSFAKSFSPVFEARSCMNYQVQWKALAKRMKCS